MPQWREPGRQAASLTTEPRKQKDMAANPGHVLPLKAEGGGEAFENVSHRAQCAMGARHEPTLLARAALAREHDPVLAVLVPPGCCTTFRGRDATRRRRDRFFL